MDLKYFDTCGVSKCIDIMCYVLCIDIQKIKEVEEKSSFIRTNYVSWIARKVLWLNLECQLTLALIASFYSNHLYICTATDLPTIEVSSGRMWWLTATKDSSEDRLAKVWLPFLISNIMLFFVVNCTTDETAVPA